MERTDYEKGRQLRDYEDRLKSEPETRNSFVGTPLLHYVHHMVTNLICHPFGSGNVAYSAF